MAANPSVLIVDDDPDTLSSLAGLLKQKRFSPLTASSLKEAQEISATESVDAKSWLAQVGSDHQR